LKPDRACPVEKSPTFNLYLSDWQLALDRLAMKSGLQSPSMGGRFDDYQKDPPAA
jgi:hypothetical protein